MLKHLTQVMSINLVLLSIALIPESLLRKGFNFKHLFFAKITAVVVSGLLAILFASHGYGVWSLVARGLIMNLISMILLFIFSSYQPSLEFSKSHFKELMNYSFPLLGSQLLNFLARNLDNLLIGKFMGKGQLGVYSRAYQLLLVPVKSITGVINKVLFPAFSEIQDEKERIMEIFGKSIWVVSNMIAPIMLSFYFCAEAFVILVLGESWTGAIPLLRIFSITGFVQSITTLVGSVFNAQGETKLHFKINFVISILTLLGIIFAIRFNLVVLAWTITALSIISLLVNYYFISRILKCTLRFLLAKILDSLFISSLIFVGILFCQYCISFGVQKWLHILFTPVSIIVIYYALLKLFSAEGFKMILEIFFYKFGNEGKKST